VRWLPKAERERRDIKIVRLHEQGLSHTAIADRFNCGIAVVARALEKQREKATQVNPKATGGNGLKSHPTPQKRV
jgi:transposase